MPRLPYEPPNPLQPNNPQGLPPPPRQSMAQSAPATPVGSNIADLPKIHPGDNLSAGDTINYTGNITNDFFKTWSPFQDMTADMLMQALSGNIPGATAPLIAGRMSAVNAAIPQAQRQITDATPQGGAQIEALTNLSQQGVSERAKAVQDVLGPLQAQGMEMGTNVAARAIQYLLGAGGLRVGLKAANNGGGGKK